MSASSNKDNIASKKEASAQGGSTGQNVAKPDTATASSCEKSNVPNLLPEDHFGKKKNKKINTTFFEI